MFESSGLVESTPAPIQWTASTNPPTFAERFAVRQFRMFRRQLHPWWLVTLPIMAIHVFNIVRAWPGEGRVVPFVFFMLLVVFLSWSNQGFCELLDRYDAELRQHRNR